MSEKRLFKELKKLRKNPASLENPQILDLSPIDEDESILKWQARIAKPNRKDSPYYHNGMWKLEINASTNYPIVPPEIKFSQTTPINHPNINIDTGEICLDILKSDLWSPAWNLEHLVGAILMLLDDPEPDSPLNVDLANLFRSDKVAFESAVQYTMWKYNTFFDGIKEPTGVKALEIMAYDNSSEEEDEVQEEPSDDEEYYAAKEHDETHEDHDEDGGNDADEEKDGNTDQTDVFTFTTAELGFNEAAAQRKKKDSISYIHSVGREVTEEFLKKATEVESLSPDNLSKSPSSQLLQTLHHHVSMNVAKQVEEICQNSLNSPSSLQPKVFRREETKPDVEKIKEDFLRQIDQKVQEFQGLHAQRRTVV